MLDSQADPHPIMPADSASHPAMSAAPDDSAAGVPVMRPWPAADLGRVRAVIDALPEAVFVTESDGALRLTNPAADRLFAGAPVHDRADLLDRFEEVAPAGRSRPILRHLEESRGPVTVRPRSQPNRWFTLRTVALDPSGPTAPNLDGERARDARGPRPEAAPTGVLPADGSARSAPPAGADDGEDAGSSAPSDGATVFVLRDVTDTRELRPVREAFLAILSHELRTPITTIYAGSSVLARRGTLSPPASRTLASDISAEAARLYDLVEDLLVLARLERRVLDPLDEPVLIQRSVDATVRTAADRFGDGLVVQIGDGDVPPVHGDATYVEQACRNLVMASIRYAEDDPERRLSVVVRADLAGGEAQVIVLDRGPGLSPDELDRAFELPEASSTGRLAAAGVGPFVCRHLIEAMGGRVWARNRPGGGLELGFALRIDERA